MPNITFTRPDGTNCPAYLVEAVPQSKAGIVLLQEWWGLNPQIRATADRLAAAGFQVLAPDLYKGRVTQDPDEANHLMNGLDFAGATHQDVRGAVRHLLGTSCSKVAVMGFCMGGALTVASAVHVPELSAAVCYYGIPPAEFADPAHIRIPFQGHFADADTWCTPAAADALERAMLVAGQQPVLFRYPAAHGFFNDTRPAYQTECAEQAWQRTVLFLRQHLCS